MPEICRFLGIVISKLLTSLMDIYPQKCEVWLKNGRNYINLN